MTVFSRTSSQAMTTLANSWEGLFSKTAAPIHKAEQSTLIIPHADRVGKRVEFVEL